MSVEMENSNRRHNKSLKFLSDKSESLASPKSSNSKNAHQVLIQQSVTLLALKSKATGNSTAAPDSLQPRLILGVLPEDLPLFIGAIIGASFVIAVCIVIFFIWKCCTRMTVLTKKKQYWLQHKSASSIKGKYKIPVVHSNSVVFLGLKSSQTNQNSTSEDCIITKFVSNSIDEAVSFGNPLHYSMSSASNAAFSADSSSLVPVISPLLGDRPVTQSHHDIPIVTIHQDSPDLFHHDFHSGRFDQHSLYSYDSHVGSEPEFRNSGFTWSHYSLRTTSTTDGYHDLFQKANICKKRKNRMRSDIAAAIALNKSPQKSRDTDLLVENAVEVVSDERTTL